MKDLSPTVTAREYISALSLAIKTLHVNLEVKRQSHRAGFSYLTTTRHRLLGIAHLRQGNRKAAVKHLEIALQLLKGEPAARFGLYDGLYIQCEEALLRLILVPLYMRLGQVSAARFLVTQGQRPGKQRPRSPGEG